MRQTKKQVGGLEFIRAFMIGLAVIVVLAFALSLMAGNLYNSATPATTTGSVANETNAYINRTGYTLSVISERGFSSPVITAIYNATNGVLLNSGNYTISSSGVLTNATAVNFINVSLVYKYSYQYDSDAQRIVSNFSSGLSSLGGNISTWITLASLVVIVGIIAVVIYLVSRFGGSSEMS